MRVWITLDKMDGSQSRISKQPVYLDEIDMHGMLFYLNQRDVAGVSFVRADVLTRLDQLETRCECGDKIGHIETCEFSKQKERYP